MGKNQAQINYRKKAVKTLYLDLNIKTDADIIQWLEREPNKAKAVKEACRRNIPKHMINHNAPSSSYKYLCPTCEKIYIPSEKARYGYCSCGQRIINLTQAQEAENEKLIREYIRKKETCTPVDTEAQASTPVNSSPETCTPVNTEALKKAKAYAGKGETYLISYVLKKGKRELQREAIIRGYNKKGAIQNFRKWHEETKEGGEGHAFRPTATRKWGKNGLDPLTTPEAEAIPQIHGESAEQWEQDAENFWRKVDEEIAANARKEK